MALRGLLGDAAPLSPGSLARLKAQWHVEYEAWKQRRLDALEVVYVWADGLYVKAGLDDTKAALLVMIGALTLHTDPGKLTVRGIILASRTYADDNNPDIKYDSCQVAKAIVAASKANPIPMQMKKWKERS